MDYPMEGPSPESITEYIMSKTHTWPCEVTLLPLIELVRDGRVEEMWLSVSSLPTDTLEILDDQVLDAYIEYYGDTFFIEKSLKEGGSSTHDPDAFAEAEAAMNEIITISEIVGEVLWHRPDRRIAATL